MERTETPVALSTCPNYDAPHLGRKVGELLDAARLNVARSEKILVKPNLLLAKKLACTDAALTAAICSWLLDQGARIQIYDSPGFGRASCVAEAIGLADALKPLGLGVSPPGPLAPLRIRPAGANKTLLIKVAALCLEQDRILSVAKVKAHSQMRLTLCVKNCFGCIPGMRKALIHAGYGHDRAFFADCLAALWAALPPVAAFADGIMAMDKTGPSKGAPFHLGLLGASASAPMLDSALLEVLGIDPALVPLEMAMRRRAAAGLAPAGQTPAFPLESPAGFHVKGFEIPAKLATASFNPARLVKSCIKRLWAQRSG